MNKFIFIFLLLPFSLFAKVDFHKGSLATAQNKAAAEGKLYFIDFFAGWCLPCKLMDETTFLDPDLGAYVSQNYIPVKLNFDDFDAYDYKVKYQVDNLPTILIFSSDGRMLTKIVGSVRASRLLETLRKYDLPENRVRSGIVSTAAPSIPSTKPIAPVSKPNFPQTKPTVSVPPSTPENNFSVTLNTTPPAVVKPPSVPKPETNNDGKEGDGLFEFTAIRHPSRGYGVQIGVFAQYGNVIKQVELLQKEFPAQRVVVHITQAGTQVAYRIAIGTFASPSQAKNFLNNQMKPKNFNGFVKDFSVLK